MIALTISIILVFLSSLGPHSPQPAPSSLVVASQERISKDGRYLEFTLHNLSSQAVTAWEVLADYTRADGRVTRRGHGREGYEVYAGVYLGPGSEDRVIPPGEVIHPKVVLPRSDSFVSVSVRLQAAVFADGTWLGPEREVSAIFARRAADSLAWSHVQRSLGRVRSQGTSPATMTAIMDDLASPADPSFSHPSVRQTRENLQRLVEGRVPSTSSQSLDQILQLWLSNASDRARAAATHARRGREAR